MGDLWSSAKEGISNAINDPIGTYKDGFEKRGGFAAFFGPYQAYKMLKGSWDWGYNTGMAALSGDSYAAGYSVGSYYTGAAVTTALTFGAYKRGISFPGWKGFHIGNRQITFGYTKTYGIGVSYRVTRNGLTLAKDYHTINGKLQYHYHYIEAGKFTKGHLSPRLLKTNGFRFNDLKQGLPNIKWKKSPLWRALEDSKY